MLPHSATYDIQPEIMSLENQTRSRGNCTPLLWGEHLFFKVALLACFRGETAAPIVNKTGNV
jgi:hypothetical protein